MELVVARNRKERIALKYGETFLKLMGLSLEDLVEFRKALIENQTLVAANTALLKENKQLKGEINPDEKKEDGVDLMTYLTEK